MRSLRMLVLFTALATGALAGVVALPHCVAMCGPYAGFACAGGGALAPRTSGVGSDRTLRYLAGRGLGYSALGAFAGGTGRVAGALLPPTWAALLLAAMLAGGMLALAWRLARADRRAPALVALRPGRPAPRSRESASPTVEVWLARALALASRSPALLGLAMTTFPCGALYAALLVAASTASPWAGAASMLGFALTSGVALGLSGWIARASVALDRHTRLALSAALVVGAVILVARPLLVLDDGAPPVCEHPAGAVRP